MFRLLNATKASRPLSSVCRGGSNKAVFSSPRLKYKVNPMTLHRGDSKAFLSTTASDKAKTEKDEFHRLEFWVTLIGVGGIVCIAMSRKKAYDQDELDKVVALLKPMIVPFINAGGEFDAGTMGLFLEAFETLRDIGLGDKNVLAELYDKCENIGIKWNMDQLRKMNSKQLSKIHSQSMMSSSWSNSTRYSSWFTTNIFILLLLLDGIGAANNNNNNNNKTTRKFSKCQSGVNR